MIKRRRLSLEMYVFGTLNKRVKKAYRYYLHLRPDVHAKLRRIAEDPRQACDAHKLHGPLEGKWSCWLGSNIRLIYKIDDEKKEVIIFAIGPHEIYG